MKSPKEHVIRRLSKDNPSFQAMKGEPASDQEALYPTNPDIDAHNDKIATMLELVQRNQELKERLKMHKHTDECLAYAAKTGKAFCIAECSDARLKALGE